MVGFMRCYKIGTGALTLLDGEGPEDEKYDDGEGGCERHVDFIVTEMWRNKGAGGIV
jgi:hypothetical protein